MFYRVSFYTIESLSCDRTHYRMEKHPYGMELSLLHQIFSWTTGKNACIAF